MSKFVKAIILKYTGDISTIKCNKAIDIETPQLKHLIGIKNKGVGEIGQIGSWDDIDLDGHIFYIYGWLNGTEPKKNNIILPYPYDDLELYNDIIIIKTDLNNTLCNLSEDEYEIFYKEISGIIESDNSDIEEVDYDIIKFEEEDINEKEDDNISESIESEEEEDESEISIKQENDELELTDEEV